MKVKELFESEGIKFFDDVHQITVMGQNYPLDIEDIEAMTNHEKNELISDGDTLAMIVAGSLLPVSKLSQMAIYDSENNPFEMQVCNNAFVVDRSDLTDYELATGADTLKPGSLFGVRAVWYRENGYDCYFIAYKDKNTVVSETDYLKGTLGVKTLDKNKILKSLLTMYKDNHQSDILPQLISLLKTAGYYYPEIAAIEKSRKANFM